MVTIEDVKAFWDRRPCNVKHGFAPVGSSDWSRQVTQRKYFVEPHIKEFAEFSRWRGKRVLDVGCGIGTDVLEFLRAGALVDAMDISVESLKLAAQRINHEFYLKSTKPPVNFYLANIEEWTPEGKYDLIYSFGALHHTPNPAAALENMYRALKPGGELKLMLYAKYSWKNLTRQQPEAQAGCPIVKKYSKIEAEMLVRDAGFCGVRIAKTHIFPWELKAYLDYRYVKAYPWRLMSPAVFHRLEKLLGWHLLISATKPLGWKS